MTRLSKRGVYLYIDGKEIKNDINSIDLEMKRLQRDIKEMTRGSEEYNRTMAKIQHLQGILKQHRQEIKGITTETKKATVSIGSMVDWFNRFGGVILSVIGFLTGFTLALRAIRDERNKLEESQAGLKALTGLDDDSIAWLTGQAKTLSTTMTKRGLACPPVGSRNPGCVHAGRFGQAGTAGRQGSAQGCYGGSHAIAGGSQGHHPERSG